MKWTGVNELREKYLSFFESKGHLRLESFPLIPKDDNSLLLINSGMAPMKKYFTGEITPPSKRVATCQKCIRTPDIERVGITARHGTFFNMLGNFSFGDYFKNEATAWAWEFFTKELEIPAEMLYVSVYEEDDETYDIWVNNIGVKESHLVRMGKEDNFWEHGAGPCGPCSEIYFDRGEKYGCGDENCAVGCECDRYVEVWNLVFTQFNSDGKGNYTPLEHPNIDTGMGLERLACVMQGVDNLFLIDTVKGVMDHVSDITGVKYGTAEKTDVSLRVISDHIRSTVFMIGDGVMPSNEGRGYVLRRLLRRAARHGRLCGYNKPFLYKVAETVIDSNKDAYPELAEKHDFIIKLIKVEEENFGRTIDQGLTILKEFVDDASTKLLSGDHAFRLNDTYGFPIDLTKEILEEKGLSVDENRFYELLAQQKKRARDARKNAGADAWISENADLSDVAETEFVGYDKFNTKATILAIVKDGKRADSANGNDKVGIILNKTPFYPEGGGQVGDTGNLLHKHTGVEVLNTTKDHSGVIIHHAVVKENAIFIGDEVEAVIDKERRLDTMRNHTAAHLLQAALRKVLGSHVEQAGQLVDGSRVRFDFTHFSALTAEELLKVEEQVNAEILKAEKVVSEEMNISEAKKMGAMALFGEKYGDVVRVVRAGDFSTELCGGTHVDNTGKIGLFKILTETSVASGVRRIEAVTGRNTSEMFDECILTIGKTTQILKINNSKEIIKGSEQIAETLKAQASKIEQLEIKLAATKIDEIFKNSEVEQGVRIMTGVFEDTTADIIRMMCARIIDTAPKAVAVIAGVKGGKATFACACGTEARELGANAGKIVKAVAQLAGGNGGGKPDIAMAGAKQPEKVNSALEQVHKIVLEMI